MEVEIAKKVYGHGQGASKQIAEEAAAAEAIINIEKNR
jgi:dsRNA-specific ribonuclease